MSGGRLVASGAARAVSGGASPVGSHTGGHTRRLTAWDYTKGASLFITISTEPRAPLFGKITGGKMQYSELGQEVAVSLQKLPHFNPGLSLFGWVVMPDHVHFNVHLDAGLVEPLKLLGNAINKFKNHTLKVGRELGLPKFWQAGYYDHLCLSRRFIDSTERYIAYNVEKWELMHNTPGALHITEPLFSPRLDANDYWKGVGNAGLLDGQHKLLSLRVSMKVKTEAQIAAVVARMEKAVDAGYTIISGFISAGERAVLRMLLAQERCSSGAASGGARAVPLHMGAQLVRMRTSPIPNRAFKPESQYIRAFKEGRYLEIAMGNEEAEFSRDLCLDLNEEIVRIATANANCPGLALHWREDGPHVLARSLV